MNIKTQNTCPPIPIRNHDWMAWDDDTYCCAECRSPLGEGATEQAAIEDLLEQMDERAAEKIMSQIGKWPKNKCVFCGQETCDCPYTGKEKP